MKTAIDLSETNLDQAEGSAVVTLCKDLQVILQENLVSIALYGSALREDYRSWRSDINLLIVVEKIDISVLKSVLSPLADARRYGIAPFIVTEQNLISSADVFPVKFLSIQHSHLTLVGPEILEKLTIKRTHLRLRCEQETKNILLRLRRHFVMSSGLGLAPMLSRTIRPLLDTLAAFLSMDAELSYSHQDTIDALKTKYSVDGDVLHQVMALRDRTIPLSPEEVEQLYGRFMVQVEIIATVIDQLDQGVTLS